LKAEAGRKGGEHVRRPARSGRDRRRTGLDEAASTVALEIETWAVAPETSGFTPNVNLLAQEFPGETPAEHIAYSDTGGGDIERKRAM
jgi:hypothetical protein